MRYRRCARILRAHHVSALVMAAWQLLSGLLLTLLVVCSCYGSEKASSGDADLLVSISAVESALLEQKLSEAQRSAILKVRSSSSEPG